MSLNAITVDIARRASPSEVGLGLGPRLPKRSSGRRRHHPDPQLCAHAVPFSAARTTLETALLNLEASLRALNLLARSRRRPALAALSSRPFPSMRAAVIAIGQYAWAMVRRRRRWNIYTCWKAKRPRSQMSRISPSPSNGFGENVGLLCTSPTVDIARRAHGFAHHVFNLTCR